MVLKQKYWLIIVTIFFCIFSFKSLTAQVQIGSTNYSTLQDAFDAVSNGTQSGNIEIKITDNLELTSSAVLWATGFNYANYSSIIIYPTGNYYIKGNCANALIDLKGADNVVIDGRINKIGTTNSLTLKNENTALSTVIWLDSSSAVGANLNGCKNITIRNCNIEGGSMTNSYGIVASAQTGLLTQASGHDNVSIINNTFKNMNTACRGNALTTSYLNNFKFIGNKVGSLNEYETVANNGLQLYNVRNTEVLDNTFENILGLSGSMYGIFLTDAPKSKVYNNIINNMTTTANSFIYGIYLARGDSSVFSRNYVSNLKTTGPVWGIYLSTTKSSIVTSNKISNLRSTTANSAAVIGIELAGTCSYDTLHNNSIAKLTSNHGSNTNKANNPFGIRLGNCTVSQIVYNSVNMCGQQEGAGSSGTISAALLINSTTASALDVRNNIFVNTLEGLPGSLSYSVYALSATNISSSTFDNNILYAGGNYGILGYLNADIYNIADWRSATNKDFNSKSVDPLFNSETILIPYFNSPALNSGVAISGLTSDIENYPRNNPPTIGAYETPADVTGPAIKYNKINRTSQKNTLVFEATITDYSGVNITDKAPRLYYKKSGDESTYYGNTSQFGGWKFVTGTKNGDKFTFSMDFSKISGGSVVAGDVIDYFFVAFDSYSNPNYSLSTGNLYNPPTTTNLTAQNFPLLGAIDFFRIVNDVSGNYNIGINGDYPNFTGDDGIFKYINDNMVSGNVTLTVISNTQENGAIGLNKITEENNSNFSITIKPSNNITKVISGDYIGGLFRLNGASNVTIDGSFLGVGNYLTFTNTLTSGSIASIQIASNNIYGNGVNITIKNCNISCGHNQGNVTGYYSIGLALGDGDAIHNGNTSSGINNLVIKNNIISKAYSALSLKGTNNNMLVESNVVGSDNSSDYVGIIGMEFTNTIGLNVRKNKIFNFKNSPGNTYRGIEINSGCLNVLIDNNTIYGFRHTATTICGVYGIAINGSNGIVITNNSISDLVSTNRATPTNFYSTQGIRINGGTGHKIYNNSINLFGSYDNTTSTGVGFSACIMIASASYNGHDIRNNILSNSLAGNSGSKSFCIFYTMAIGSVPAAVSAANYNNYIAGGSQSYVGGYATTQPYSNLPSLSDLRTATGKDVNSFSEPVQFISSNNLHLNGTSVGNTNLIIPTLPEVPMDIDGITKGQTSYVGVDDFIYEFVYNTNTTLSPSQSSYCVGSPLSISVKPEIKNFSDGIQRTNLAPFTYEWYKNGTLITTETTDKKQFTSLIQSDSAIYHNVAKFQNLSLNSNPVLVTVQTPMSINKNLLNFDVCNTDPYLLLESNASGTISKYQWQKLDTITQVWVDMEGENNKNLSIILENPETAIGKYRYVVYGPGNCGAAELYSNVSNVFVTVPITEQKIVSSIESANVCVGESIELSVSAKGTIYSYEWQRLNNNEFVSITPKLKGNKLNYLLTKPEDSGIYRCLIYGSSTCNSVEEMTAPFEVKIWEQVELIEQPKKQVVCENERVTLSVGLNGSVKSYQWKKDGNYISINENQYANSQVLIFDEVKHYNSGVYLCEMEVEDCNGLRKMISAPSPIYVCTNTEITYAPETQPTAIGDMAIFEVNAHVNGAPSDYKVEVQWYKNGIELVDHEKIVGSKTNILIVKNVNSDDLGENYKVVVTGLCEKDSVTDFGIVETDVTMVEQPQNSNICENETTELKVEAKGINSEEEVIYQWYKDKYPIEDNEVYSGTKSNKLTINNASIYQNGVYYAKAKLISSKYSKKSMDATLIVNEIPSIVEQPIPTKEVIIGKDVVIKVIAEANNMTYKWYHNDVELIGENTNQLNLKNLQSKDAGTYYVEITNECGSVASKETILTVTTNISDVTNNEFEGYSISQVAPNPVNEIAQFSYTIPNQSNVTIKLYSYNGEEIATLNDDNYEAGTYNLSIDSDLLKLTSGTYLLVLNAGKIELTQKFIVIK